MSFDVISVVGLGYIGLPTAAMFSAYGKKVIGVDVSPSVVETINRGEIHIVEPELDALVHKGVSSGLLRADLKPAVADAFLIAVPTPFREGNVPDLSFIENAVGSISSVLKKGDLIILESTSPVGTTEKISAWLADLRPDLKIPKSEEDIGDLYIAHCPERVLPGKVVTELVENDRVIGGITPACSDKAVELYKTFVKGECVITNSRTAELAKLTENASRDVSIAFANELSLICDEIDVDVWELIGLANRHPRVNILSPGAGVGGHCIAVDPWFIVAQAGDLAKIIRAAREINDYKPEWVVERVVLAAEKSKGVKGDGKVLVSCFGAAFKPDIDDLRESPALKIISDLSKVDHLEVLVVEPYVNSLPESLKGRVRLVDEDEALRLSDVFALLVGHSKFKDIPWSNIGSDKIVDAIGLAG